MNITETITITQDEYDELVDSNKRKDEVIEAITRIIYDQHSNSDVESCKELHDVTVGEEPIPPEGWKRSCWGRYFTRVGDGEWIVPEGAMMLFRDHGVAALSNVTPLGPSIKGKDYFIFAWDEDKPHE